jgi:hypothetical protein
VRLINGDMVTPGAFGACMGKIDSRLDQMGVQLVGIHQWLDRIEAVPERWLIVGVVLVALLIVARVGTPFLNAMLIVR